MKDEKEKKEQTHGEEQEEKKIINLEEVDPDELKKILDIISNSDSNGSKSKLKIIGLSNRVLQNPILDILFYIVFNMLFIVASNGFFNVFIYTNILWLLVLIFVFSLLEYGLKTFIFAKKPGLYITSIGLIGLLATAISFFGPLYILSLLSKIDISSIGAVVLLMIGFLIIRSFVTYYLKAKLINNIKIKNKK